MTSLYTFFEKLRDPFPRERIARLPRGFGQFVWAGTEGVRSMLLAMAVLTAIVSVFEALLFAMLGRLVDWLASVEPASLWTLHGTTIGWLAAILLFSIAIVAMQTIVKHQALAINLPMRLRWNYHRLMLGQSMNFYQDEFAGRITTKVMQTALAVREVLFVLCDVSVMMVIYIATVFVLAGAVAPTLMWPFGIWLIAYLATLVYFVPRLGAAGKAQADARAEMTGRVTDAYTNISTVKLFSHSFREADYARAAMHGFLHTGYRQMRLVSSLEIVIHSLSMLLIGGMAGTGLWLWSQGQISVGAVAAGTALTLRLNGMSHWIMWEMTGLFESVGTIQDGINTLSQRQQVNDVDGAKRLEVSRGEVVFEQVRFNYQKTATPDISAPVVINELSLTVQPGERIGLVGRSGAGKTTLVNLLLRFFDVESGRILIDGQDISAVTQNSLRAAIGMVSQDTSLLHRSLADNIAYGRPDASEAMIRAAAEQAQASLFIDTLTDPKGRTGLHAHVGERGVKLSGGQRQRIAIARVILKNAPILLLDEATSALDSEVEAAIQHSLKTMMHGKTVIAIAHRLSTIAEMDRLIVMDAGSIIEQGTHEQLIADDGVYAQLWRRQSGGFLATDIQQASPSTGSAGSS